MFAGKNEAVEEVGNDFFGNASISSMKGYDKVFAGIIATDADLSFLGKEGGSGHEMIDDDAQILGVHLDNEMLVGILDGIVDFRTLMLEECRLSNRRIKTKISYNR